MDHPPAVSALMGVRDGVPWVWDAVESLLAQTAPDLEVIVVDDGSTDGTPDLLRAIPDPRLRVERQPPAGLTRALNRALGLARAPLLARLDADDLALPERLARQQAFLAAHPEVGLLGTGAREVDAGGREVARVTPPADDAGIRRALIRRNPFVHSSVVMRRAAVERVAGYDERLPVAQDYELWMRLSRVTRLANLPEPLVIRRLLPGRVSARREADRLAAEARVQWRARALGRLPLVVPRLPPEAAGRPGPAGVAARRRAAAAAGGARLTMAAPVRVLHLLVTTSPGGGPKHVYDLVRHLPGEEFDVVVAAPRDGVFFDRFRDLGVSMEELPLSRLGMRHLALTARLVRRRGINIVHTHGKGPGLYGRLAARWLRVPAVHTFHGIHYSGYSRAGQRLYLGLERRLSRLSHTIVNVSRSQEAEGLSLGIFRREQSVVVVNGIDVEEMGRTVRESPVRRESLGLGPDDFVLGCVSRWDPVKRFEILLRAVAGLATRILRLALLLVGGGGEEGRIRRLVAETGLQDRVIFTGFLGNPTRVYGILDLYVATSLKEGLPLAPLEAMAASLPIVATDVPGHRDVVAPGETGLLVPPEDSGALAEAIAALAAAPARRRRMGEAGRRRVQEHFAIRAMVEAHSPPERRPRHPVDDAIRAARPGSPERLRRGRLDVRLDRRHLPHRLGPHHRPAPEVHGIAAGRVRLGLALVRLTPVADRGLLAVPDSREAARKVGLPGDHRGRQAEHARPQLRAAVPRRLHRAATTFRS